MVIEVTDFPVYSVMMALSFLLGNAVYVLTMARAKASKFSILSCVITNCMFAAFGGTTVSFLMSGFKTWGGMTSIGGVFGLILSYLFNSRLFLKDREPIRKSLYLATPLMYSVSKLGCHFAGCCTGMHYTGPFAVTYEGEKSYLVGGQTFPVQITEVFVFFIIFTVGAVLLKSSTKEKELAVASACCIAKFLLDFLRMRNGIISANQVMCLLILFCFFVEYKASLHGAACETEMRMD